MEMTEPPLVCSVRAYFNLKRSSKEKTRRGTKTSELFKWDQRVHQLN